MALAGDEDAARAEEADAAHDLRRHTERIARHTEILCLIQARHHNGRRADAHKKMRAQSGGVLALAAGHADDAAAEKCDGKAHQHGNKIHFVQMLYNSAERCHTPHPFRIKVTKPETAYRFFVVIIVQHRKKCKNIFYKIFTRFFLIVKIQESSPVDPPPRPAFSAPFKRDRACRQDRFPRGLGGGIRVLSGSAAETPAALRCRGCAPRS